MTPPLPIGRNRRPPLAARLPGAANQPPAVRDLGALLRSVFATVEEAPLPDRFAQLLDALAAGEAATAIPHPVLGDGAFKAQLTAVIPHLRAFGRSLSGNPDLADDLVQETLLKAWSARERFQAGTNMRAWTYVILRNVYFSHTRRGRFKGDWDELSADLLLAVPATQEDTVALSDLQRGLMQLPVAQREALILVGAGGMPYGEVAAICGCAIGTIKSRVARARVALEALMTSGQLNGGRADADDTGVAALDAIMHQVSLLSSR